MTRHPGRRFAIHRLCCGRHVVDVPGYSKPAHQYGVTACQRELDEAEAAELVIWERDGFTVRTEESTT